MHDLSVFFAITFVTVLTPGAGVLFTISSALRGGMRSAWQAPLGNVARPLYSASGSLGDCPSLPRLARLAQPGKELPFARRGRH